MVDLRIFAVCAVLAVGACTENDTEITRRVHERLAAEAATDDDIKVSTERRIVVLEGVVTDQNELNRVERATRNVPGILGVDNRIVVQSPVNTTGGTPTPAP
jgi:osmotically-inducible protein OsmY